METILTIAVVIIITWQWWKAIEQRNIAGAIIFSTIIILLYHEHVIK